MKKKKFGIGDLLTIIFYILVIIVTLALSLCIGFYKYAKFKFFMDW